MTYPPVFFVFEEPEIVNLDRLKFVSLYDDQVQEEYLLRLREDKETVRKLSETMRMLSFRENNFKYKIKKFIQSYFDTIEQRRKREILDYFQRTGEIKRRVFLTGLAMLIMLVLLIWLIIDNYALLYQLAAFITTVELYIEFDNAWTEGQESKYILSRTTSDNYISQSKDNHHNWLE